MRNLLLVLLLANIMYFLYERYVEELPEAGVSVIGDDQLGPPLELDEPPPSAEAGGAAPGPGKPADLALVVGRSCVTVGPFTVESDADNAFEDFVADDLSVAQRTTDGEVFVGHWVQIRNIADRSAGNEMLATLKDGGLGDAYIVETDDEGLKISLGLFGEVARAERIELQAKSLGLPAEITPRTRAATVYFVDIGLPPGRGATSIVEKFGEDKVRLRDQATCPSGS